MIPPFNLVRTLKFTQHPTNSKSNMQRLHVESSSLPCHIFFQPQLKKRPDNFFGKLYLPLAYTST